MLYTIGHEESYDKGIEEEKGKLFKSGRKEGYNGGIVFFSTEDAVTYILHHNLASSYAVYELENDYSKIEGFDENDYGTVIEDMRIIQKIMSSKEIKHHYLGLDNSVCGEQLS